MKTCPTCNGSGADPEDKEFLCPQCGGAQLVEDDE